MVKQFVSKKEKLEVTLKKFEESLKGVNDYMELFMVFRNVISHDSGLLWSEVEEVIKNILEEREVINANVILQNIKYKSEQISVATNEIEYCAKIGDIIGYKRNLEILSNLHKEHVKMLQTQYLVVECKNEEGEI